MVVTPFCTEGMYSPVSARDSPRATFPFGSVEWKSLVSAMDVPNSYLCSIMYLFILSSGDITSRSDSALSSGSLMSGVRREINVDNFK